jgi:hypothetical protein
VVTSRPGHFTPRERNTVPIVDEAGWAPGPGLTVMEKRKSLALTGFKPRSSQPVHSRYTDYVILVIPAKSLPAYCSSISLPNVRCKHHLRYSQEQTTPVLTDQITGLPMLESKTRTQSQGSTCGKCRGKYDNETGFSPITSVLPSVSFHQCATLTHLTLTPYNFSK